MIIEPLVAMADVFGSNKSAYIGSAQQIGRQPSRPTSACMQETKA